MVVLDGQSLSLEQIRAVARNAEHVALDAEGRSRMETSRATVTRLASLNVPIYAVNTGVGLLANTRLEEPQIEQLQLNVVRSHACGCGPPLPREVVRGMMLIRANTLVKGLSGVRPQVAEALCDLLNRNVTPVVPSRGSVGASGDLAPLAHIALTLIGEGRAEYEGEVQPSMDVLRAVKITPLRLAAKEGISLLNGTQAMLSLGVLQMLDLEDLVASADVVSALTIDALLGHTAAFDERIHASRPHSGQRYTASALLALLAGSGFRPANFGSKKVQDAYSLRCIPQVHGAVRDAMQYVRNVMAIEINAATDNPLVFGDEVLSGGNFHGAPLALAFDFLAIALCSLAGISERRMERLVNPVLNEGLPAFLASQPGLESGLMMAQVTAAALVAEIRVLANPASTGSIPTSGNQEDFVSMGMTSALKLSDIVRLTRQVIAIEAIAANRALQLRPNTRSSEALEKARTIFRGYCPMPLEDCILSDWIARAEECLATPALAEVQRSALRAV